MKKIGELIRKGYGSERFRWLFSFLCVLAIIGIAAGLSTLTYYDNDDLNIAWALAGYRSGTPSFAHPFINCLTAILTSALYTILPGLPWWLILQLAATAAGMTAVFACILKTGHKNGLPLLPALLLLVALGAGLFYYGIVLVTFTLSAAAAGSGAVALVLAVDSGDSKKTQRGYLIGSVALLAVSLLVRNSSGLAAACFTVGALIYRAGENRMEGERALAKRLLAFFAVTVAAASILAGINEYGREAQNPEGFVAYDEARSSYMDYPVDSYSANPALYQQAGWDGTLAALASSWFYLDERITTDAFSTISSGSAFENTPMIKRLTSGVANIGGFFRISPLAIHYGVLVLAAYASALALLLLNRKRWTAFFGASAYLLGAVLLLAYLISSGRMNLRVWMTVCILSSVSIWLCALKLMRPREEGKRAAYFLRLAALALALAVSLGFGYKVFRTVISYENETPDMLARAQAVVAYVQKHPDNVYFRDVYAANNVDALSIYADDPPTNLIDWGGCDMNTITRERQLEVNGLDGTFAKDLFPLKNVYYIGESTNRYLPMFAEYMQQHCNASGYEITDTIIDDIVAVHFTFEGAE
ncbi:MAG: hypothetical protein LLF75_07200 [Eubacteriales bacterium]|nr:hypothetical protein [Eubacteriales bacterium]